MKKFKMVFLATWYHYVISLGIFIVGVVLTIIGLNTSVTGLTVAGIIVALMGFSYFLVSFLLSRDKARSICSNCNKKMLAEGKTVNYSYQCTDFRDKHDNQGNYTGTEFNYVVTITCPHCGSTNTFTKKTVAKSSAKATTYMDKYIKGLLKMK